MTRLAIVEPSSLLGRELRDQLDARREIWQELKLLTSREDSVGNLSEVSEQAAMVQRLDKESLDDLDLIFLCGPSEQELDFLATIPPRLRAVVVAPTAPVPSGRTAVAGWKPEQLEGEQLVVSPHPAVVALAHTLLPLEGLGLEEVVATVLRPVSMFEQDALDEMLEQTRALLEFRNPEPGKYFDQQMAFNLLPGPDEGELVAEQLRALFSSPPRIGITTLQASVFHGLSVSIFCRLDPDTSVETVRELLEEQPHLEFGDGSLDVGPIAATALDKVLVGEVKPAAQVPGGVWIWAVLDNLTRGSASNAVEIAGAMLSG